MTRRSAARPCTPRSPAWATTARKRKVGGFIGQEAIHGREHCAFNRRLSELGYPTLFLERFTDRLLAVGDKVLSPYTCLAAIAALEGYTAPLAEQLLGDEETCEVFGDKKVRGRFCGTRSSSRSTDGRFRRLPGGGRRRANASDRHERHHRRLGRRSCRRRGPFACSATGRSTTRVGSPAVFGGCGVRRS